MRSARSARLLLARTRRLLRRPDRGQALVLAAALAATGGLWGFVELSDEVLEGDTGRFDRWVLRSLRSAENPDRPIGPRWLVNSAAEITALGGTTVLTLITVVVLGYLLLQRKHHATAFVLGAVAGGSAVSTALKYAFGRERPDVVPHLTHFSTPSFPSGHAFQSAVVYLTLGILLAQIERRWHGRLYFIAVALLLTLLIGLTRVYLGVHYPTDVLAGWTAGLTWALLAWLVASWLQRRGAVEGGESEARSAAGPRHG